MPNNSMARTIENLRGILAIHIRQYQNVLTHVKLMLNDTASIRDELTSWCNDTQKESEEPIDVSKIINEWREKAEKSPEPIPLPVFPSYYSTTAKLCAIVYFANVHCAILKSVVNYNRLLKKITKMHDTLDEFDAHGHRKVCRSAVDSAGLRIERLHDDLIEYLRELFIVEKHINEGHYLDIRQGIFEDNVSAEIDALAARTDVCHCTCKGGTKMIYHKHGPQYPIDRKYAVL